MKKFDLNNLDVEEMQRSFKEYMQKKYPGVEVGLTVRTIPLDEVDEVIEQNKRGAEEGMTKQ